MRRERRWPSAARRSTRPRPPRARAVMTLDDLCAQVLSHLHANSAMRLDDVAAAIGRSREDVEAAAARLEREGHIERQGDRLVPDAASHPTPGIYVANERTTAQPIEV